MLGCALIRMRRSSSLPLRSPNCGAAPSALPDIRRAARQKFLERALLAFEVVPYSEKAAVEHARLWADIEATGQRMSPHDLILAATARGMRRRNRHLQHAAFRGRFRIDGAEALAGPSVKRQWRGPSIALRLREIYPSVSDRFFAAPRKARRSQSLFVESNS